MLFKIFCHLDDRHALDSEVKTRVRKKEEKITKAIRARVNLRKASQR